MKRCFRCQGRKKMYKVGSAYSMTDCGGAEVTCPLCNGEGQIDMPKEVKKRKKRVAKLKVIEEAKVIDDGAVVRIANDLDDLDEIEVKKDK